ncbi:uncharacterized protein LOC112517669 [Cynara cardunculus var. scolymus]|uniref:uncharacterized protein LOC112517669 n=1 Tax=Cynara cardunculus var. scolymus TaxID=59895 RepID=UPI000D62D264|nr:uncharacterized protein LOC112517669 [Cynara cardunculus var. scolymus]
MGSGMVTWLSDRYIPFLFLVYLKFLEWYTGMDNVIHFQMQNKCLMKCFYGQVHLNVLELYGKCGLVFDAKQMFYGMLLSGATFKSTRRSILQRDPGGSDSSYGIMGWKDCS